MLRGRPLPLPRRRFPFGRRPFPLGRQFCQFGGDRDYRPKRRATVSESRGGGRGSMIAVVRAGRGVRPARIAVLRPQSSPFFKVRGMPGVQPGFIGDIRHKQTCRDHPGRVIERAGRALARGAFGLEVLPRVGVNWGGGSRGVNRADGGTGVWTTRGGQIRWGKDPASLISATSPRCRWTARCARISTAAASRSAGSPAPSWLACAALR